MNFDEFDVYAYIFQAEKSRSSGWVQWGDVWSFYELNLYQKVESQKFTVDLVEKEKRSLSFQYKYQYKIVFLTAPKGSSVFPLPEKEDGGLFGEDHYNFSYESEALTNLFKWNVDGTQTDNAIYRDVVEILSNDEDNFDDIEFEGNITDIPVELYHKDGVLRVTVAQDLLPENVRSKAVKAELTIGNVPAQMHLLTSLPAMWSWKSIVCRNIRTLMWSMEFPVRSVCWMTRATSWPATVLARMRTYISIRIPFRMSD